MGLRNMTLRVPSRGRSERRLFSPVSWIFGGGGQSWIVDGLIIDTAGAWQWVTGREGALSQKKLKKGLNTIRITPREAAAGKEALMDVFLVSTKLFNVTDKHYKDAKQQLAVEPAGKLTATWAALKNNF